MNTLTARGGALVVGSPEEITQKILDLRDVLGVDRFFGQVDFGGMPQAMVEASIERFATEVAPAVRRTGAGQATKPPKQHPSSTRASKDTQ